MKSIRKQFLSSQALADNTYGSWRGGLFSVVPKTGRKVVPNIYSLMDVISREILPGKQCLVGTNSKE
jgi:hypothetical protein